jgi:hypothetical protein
MCNAKSLKNMNANTRIILTGTACILAGVLACALPSVASAAENPTPPVDNQMAGPPPSSGHVWMAGHWNSENGQWKWVAGHWDLPPSRSAVWVPGHWMQGSGGWAWVNGAWNVAEVPQSPDAPPLPPGEGAAQNANQAQGGQGMPMPSSPAPNVAGQYQYAPGTQVPAIYQQPTDTYYPPDYSVAYPGYYWDGAAWGWGFYPGFALGLGWWGPGWGHGGFVRGSGFGHHAGFAGHVGAGHSSGGHFSAGHSR